MSNVLPSEAREKISRLTRARLIALAAIMSALVGLVATLALLPAFLSTAIPFMTSGEPASGASQETKLNDENRTQVARVKSTLAVLAPYAEEHSSPQVLIARLYALQPAGVEIETIKYSFGTPGRIVVSGISEAREPVNDFRTALVAEGAFESVSVPVAALVGALDGRFTMTLTGQF